MSKLHPYELRFQSERCTDVQEGEELLRVIAKEPFFSLARLRALDRPRPNLELLAKANESIFEHSVHQRRLRAHGGEFDPRVEELLWQYADMGRPLIPGVPVCRRRLR